MEQSLKWVHIRKPKGIFLIIVLYLILASIFLYSAILSISMLFPGDPVRVSYEDSLADIYLFGGMLGFACLGVCYGLLNKKSWSYLYTRVISTITLIGGLAMVVTTIYMFYSTLTAGSSDIKILPYPSAKAMQAILGINYLTTSVIMIYVLRYLRKPEVESWFAEAEDKETTPSDES